MTGPELKKIRKSARLSQTDFGKIAGVGRPAVSDWERGINPIPQGAENLARVLDKYPEVLPDLERWSGLR